ncbi:MAG: polyhydroxyalkanoic acid system family protein [Xanthomonadales bacterium]|nr:polyhydroxyalkanoic acid system family protein [Xanthomonadaceae bacterium]MBN8224258.1 polyhydroxyalkanoic acid system family protein [Xanthomonadales bacterium]MCA0198271.1 polyhydroxyalkanoic acid system family protein [Pseudomonadota bacterium]HRF84877.1 polyhydroxyalkanoic acid system family protein [Pseudoxanthomonas sp.]
MSRIDILHPHGRSDQEARHIVEGIVDQLHQRYGVAGDWGEDAVALSGPGLHGWIRLAPGQVRVTADLGLLLSALHGPVEGEIRRVLGERLG